MNALCIVLTALLAGSVAAPAATAQVAAPSVPAPSVPGSGEAAKPHAASGHGAAGKPAGKPDSAPVVTAPANAHAQKPGPARAGAAAPAGKAAPKAGEPARAAAPPEPPKNATAEPPKAAAAEPAKAAAADPGKGSVTGLPLPRWASLKSDEVNLRKGPGTRYPIEWIYRRHDLPVQIEREYEVWRMVEDQDGVKGWVHQANLTGRRSFVVKGGERVLHRSGAEDAAAVARLRPGVVGRIRACEARGAWCEVQVGDYRGWLKRDDMFGIYAGEVVP